jgi:hypothetical protein
MVAIPVAWAVLLLFHPTGEGDEFYPVVRDQVTAWLVGHVGTLVFVPLLAGVVYLLLRGVEGVAALLSRIALAVFALFYTAWEVLIGSARASSWTKSMGFLRPSGRPGRNWSRISPVAPSSAPSS